MQPIHSLPTAKAYSTAGCDHGRLTMWLTSFHVSELVLFLLPKEAKRCLRHQKHHATPVGNLLSLNACRQHVHQVAASRAKSNPNTAIAHRVSSRRFQIQQSEQPPTLTAFQLMTGSSYLSSRGWNLGLWRRDSRFLSRRICGHACRHVMVELISARGCNYYSQFERHMEHGTLTRLSAAFPNGQANQILGPHCTHTIRLPHQFQHASTHRNTHPTTREPMQQWRHRMACMSAQTSASRITAEESGHMWICCSTQTWS